jgi:hypothetical protein
VQPQHPRRLPHRPSGQVLLLRVAHLRRVGSARGGDVGVAGVERRVRWSREASRRVGIETEGRAERNDERESP